MISARQMIHRLIAPGAGVLVGVSGGVDSLVLLHVLCDLRDSLDLTVYAATLDHGIRGAAGAADAEFVRQTAAAWDVPAIVGRADVPAVADRLRLGLEEAARLVRYDFLRRAARRVGISTVAVGHNQDDQAETVLMHLIRGSGLSGLRGMLARVALDHVVLPADMIIEFDPPGDDRPGEPDVWLVRPLLDTPRSAITTYAAAHGLSPRQDATNADLTFFRNRLRHEVIPLLETLNPAIRAHLARMADTLQADAALIERAGEAALVQVIRESPAGMVILDRAGWAGLALAEQRYVIRAVVRRLRPALRDVTFVHVEQALDVAGQTGAEATLPGGLVFRVGYDTLTIAELAVGDPPPHAPALDDLSPVFSPAAPFVWMAGGWVFEAGPLTPGVDLAALHADPLAAALAVPPDARLSLRTRQPGDRFRPRGLGGRSQKLSDTLINMKVPISWRDRVPLLDVDGEIAWFVAPTAAGLRGRVAEPFALRESESGRGRVVIVRWRVGEIAH